jgi:hypothetical protein
MAHKWHDRALAAVPAALAGVFARLRQWVRDSAARPRGSNGTPA